MGHAVVPEIASVNPSFFAVLENVEVLKVDSFLPLPEIAPVK